MVIFVVICNLLITVLNLYILIKILQWRRNLAKVAYTLNHVEKRVHEVLEPAPNFVRKGEQGTHYLREQINILVFQLEQLQKLGAILGLGSRIWRSQFRRRKRSGF